MHFLPCSDRRTPSAVIEAVGSLALAACFTLSPAAAADFLKLFSGFGFDFGLGSTFRPCSSAPEATS